MEPWLRIDLQLGLSQREVVFLGISGGCLVIMMLMIMGFICYCCKVATQQQHQPQMQQYDLIQPYAISDELPPASPVPTSH